MATTTNLLSWEAFEKLPDDGMHHELIEGEHQVLPPPKSRHTEVARRVSRALLVLEDKKLGRIYLEGGYKLTHDQATWIQPDVSCLSETRAKEADPDGYFQGSPELAVEVISPSESAADIERKIELLLEYGSLAVWVFYPRSQKVRVHLQNGTESPVAK